MQKDANGEGCDAYSLYPSWCGSYDTPHFISDVLCCACRNASNVRNATNGTSKECIDKDGAMQKDANGEGCDVYSVYPSWCGYYDTPRFISDVLCCACKGDTVPRNASNVRNATNGTSKECIDKDGAQC
eukprot:TRINITY_DN2779_c0_g1_i6.p2 TRINITY_DN2779_c0_g1~~TRINITY_DN2779_c0_g1_i6.p2  ORF type:complete len:140 (-),score=28.41 TRINITY_DN2779_c0_g1_i6:37-423(-)